MTKKQERQNLLGKKLKKFNFVQKLGSGSFGTVYKAINTKTDQIVAIKVISKAQMKEIPKLQKLVKSEIQILKEVSNENVIKFVDSFSSDESVFIATQFCNGGDLEKYCKEHGKIDQAQALVYLKQILNGFKGLHQKNTMHRDFKLANVLLHNNVCKIADLGFAKQLKDKALTATLLGTDQTMAPEVHQGKQYGWVADIWSLGVVFYQMLYGRVPYKGSNDYQILRNIKLTKPQYTGADVSDQAIDFIQKCLVPEPNKRMTWKQIYNHPLLYKSDITLTTGLLRSKISFQSHKNYYEANEQQKRKTIKPSEFQQRTKVSQNMFENAGEIKNADFRADAIRKTKQQLETQFAHYQKDIIDQRNNRMFGITLILPLQKQFKNIQVNHSRALYLICKKCFIDLKDFRLQIVDPKNRHYKSYKYWKQFKEQQIFKNICDQLLEDQMFAQSLTIAYKYDLSQSEFGLRPQNMNRKTADIQYQNFIRAYRQQLTPHLKDQNKKSKFRYIKMLKALEFMEQNQSYDIQQFVHKTDNMDVSAEQKKILKSR